MEYILMAMFSGGILDWQDISKTEYEWEEIFDNVKDCYNIEDIDINVFYGVILEMALQELAEAMRDFVEEHESEASNEFQQCSNDIFDYFEIFTNCLDTHLYYVGEEELGKEIQQNMKDKIEEINDKIGFTYINFN